MDFLTFYLELLASIPLDPVEVAKMQIHNTVFCPKATPDRKSGMPLFAAQDDYTIVAELLREWASMAVDLLDQRFRRMTTLCAFDFFSVLLRARSPMRNDTERAYTDEVFQTILFEVEELYKHYHVRQHEAAIDEEVDGDDPLFIQFLEQAHGDQGVISCTKQAFKDEIKHFIANFLFTGAKYDLQQLMQHLVVDWREEYPNMARLAELRMIAVASTIRNEQTHRHIKDLKGNTYVQCSMIETIELLIPYS